MGGRPVFFSRQMAFGALCYLVFSSQLEIGQLVVELALIKIGDAGITAPVIGVATATSLWLLKTMHTLVLGQVLPNVFVALSTELVLCRTVEASVATFAAVFPLHMALDHRPRREHRLYALGPSGTQQAHAEPKQNPRPPTKARPT